MSEWQPIETAPKDGTTILLYPTWDTPARAGEGRWVKRKRGDKWDCFGMTCPREPTHWMPLPEPPK